MFAVDSDETLLDGKSEASRWRLCLGGRGVAGGRLPEALLAKFAGRSWPEYWNSYVNDAFAHLNSLGIRWGERASGKHTDTVFYPGDGENDVCRAQRLAGTDVVFARGGSPFHAAVAGGKVRIRARLVAWESGDDILSNLPEKGHL